MDREDNMKIPEGVIPESWACVDCGINTSPGMLNRADAEKALALDKAKAALEGREASIDSVWDDTTEVYCVKRAVWESTGVGEYGGCLCIGCLEKRIGRRLKPEDFVRGHGLNLPGLPRTPRLKSRMGIPKEGVIGIEGHRLMFSTMEEAQEYIECGERAAIRQGLLEADDDGETLYQLCKDRQLVKCFERAWAEHSKSAEAVSSKVTQPQIH
jgi:hypothetical protein